MSSSRIATTSGAAITTALSHANGVVKEVTSAKDAPSIPPSTKKIRSKYRHIAAAHTKAQPSCLSHESEAAPSFLGLRNLAVLTIIVMNLRLVLENFKKYGILVTLKSDVRASDVRWATGLYLLIPCHLFVAFLIERVAMDRARAALGLRKKNDSGNYDPENEQDRKEFYNTWWRIAFIHSLNALLTLTFTSIIVHQVIHNPGIGTMCEIHAVVVGLKVWSYALTNRDLRHAMLHPSTQSKLPEIYSQCPYPRNITLANLCYFWWAPTLVYQTAYPRSPAIRWPFALKRLLECFALCIFVWLASAQYAAPVLRNSVPQIATMDLPSILERLMKLSTISLIIWLASFFALFQSFLNFVAEIMRFGDRNFYDDWWNSVTLKQYWSSWNKPVYHFMRRHIYSPLVGRGMSTHAASAIVFLFSGVLHELVVGIPTHNVLGVAFLGMVIQLPLVFATEPFAKWGGSTGKVVGNCVFWVNFVFIGQPLAALLYFYSWAQKYGDGAEGVAGVGMGVVNGTRGGM